MVAEVKALEAFVDRHCRLIIRNITHAHSKSATSNLGKNCRVCDLCVKAHDELGSWVKAVQYRSKVTRL